MQGVLIRRHRMEKSDGTFFAPGDFVVGHNVSFYGRTFHIVDADVFTRQTMAEAGLEYGPAETYPDDPFTTKSLSSQRHGFGQSLICLSLSCNRHCHDGNSCCWCCYCCLCDANFPTTCIPPSAYCLSPYIASKVACRLNVAPVYCACLVA